MTKEQAEVILRGCSGHFDFVTGKIFDHVILQGWFDSSEIEAVLTFLRAQAKPADRE